MLEDLADLEDMIDLEENELEIMPFASAADVPETSNLAEEPPEPELLKKHRGS